MNLATFLKQYGFVYPNSEIYGGLSNSFDYGPYGLMVVNNLKKIWWDFFVKSDSKIYGISSQILMNPRIWNASGHIENFIDLMIENKVNKKRYRADHVALSRDKNLDVDSMSSDEIESYIKQNIMKYDNSKVDWSNVRSFNLMYETNQGVLTEQKRPIYLRPETAQGIFVNFKNVQRSTRAKVPFGIAQIGKAFRNEITPGNFLFRTREFEQMEIEFFVKPETDEKWFQYYLQKIQDFLKLIEIPQNKLRVYEHPQDSLAHYSKKTVDIEYEFSFGWKELLGLANRQNYDLEMHTKNSDEDLNYLDPFTNEKYLPYAIEPSFGVDRLFLAVLESAFIEKEDRKFLKLPLNLAPYKIAVFPLNKKIHSQKALEVFEKLKEFNFEITYDDIGSIGKRYVRQDLIGTFFALTIDDNTLNQETVTVRNRDTTKQDIVKLSNLVEYLSEKGVLKENF